MTLYLGILCMALFKFKVSCGIINSTTKNKSLAEKGQFTSKNQKAVVCD